MRSRTRRGWCNLLKPLHYVRSLQVTHLVRDGGDPRLELEPLAEARLKVLRATQASQAPSNHDANALTQGLTLFHAVVVRPRAARYHVHRRRGAKSRESAEYVCMYVSMVITYSKSMDQPGKVANPARGQLNRENEYFPVACGFSLARRDRQSRPASACSSPYSG